MCFTLQNNADTPKIAEEDIICYKRMYVRRSIKTLFRARLNSALFESIHIINYKLGKTYNALEKVFSNKKYKEINSKITKLSIDRFHPSFSGDFSLVINEGFHSFKDRNKKSHFDDPLLITIKCVIPKGTEYCENQTEYVSTKIKFIEILK